MGRGKESVRGNSRIHCCCIAAEWLCLVSVSVFSFSRLWRNWADDEEEEGELLWLRWPGDKCVGWERRKREKEGKNSSSKWIKRTSISGWWWWWWWLILQCFRLSVLPEQSHCSFACLCFSFVLANFISRFNFFIFCLTLKGAVQNSVYSADCVYNF